MGQDLLLCLYTVLGIFKSRDVLGDISVMSRSTLVPAPASEFLPVFIRLVCSNGHEIEVFKSPLQKPGTQ